ncbi:MAG: hypothetical protein N838_33200 [Thiohalocapsa sp. PB-PSB1]|nr:MAG: hypothetical protein N838_33200 [Thiohalocapsa sp. PB-PSB1]
MVARTQTAEQPDQLDVALAFLLQPTAGANAIHVAIEIQLQHAARLVRRLSATRTAAE